MGKTCVLCLNERPNEGFRGKGPRVCSKCRKRGKRRVTHQLIGSEIFGFIHSQNNISSKNIKRLRQIWVHEDEELQALAGVILEVALLHPRKRKRIGWLRDKRPDPWRAFMKKLYFIDVDIEAEFEDDDQYLAVEDDENGQCGDDR